MTIQIICLRNISRAGTAQVSTPAGYSMDNRGSIPNGDREQSLCSHVQARSGAHSTSCATSAVVLSSEINRPERDDHPFQPNRESQNAWSCLSISHTSSWHSG
jgi:hypothetical protein